MLNDARMQILYFKENADVLLEFGLQGNYSMRLLTVHTDNYKDFLQQLSKAVGRNNIVLTVGGFDANHRLPEILGRAIGRELDAPSAEEFHICGEMPTRLPQDAIPLVSAKGVLAGCVVEKGLQSIIMLTGDATLRHQVFKDLVIPYIGDRLRCIAGGVPVTPPPAPQPEAAPSADPVTEALTEQETVLPTTEEPATEIPPIMAAPEPEATPVAQPSEPEPEPEPETDEPQPEESEQPPVPDIFSSSEELEFDATQEEPAPAPKRSGRGARIAGTLMCILLALLVTLGACGLLYYVLRQKQQESPAQPTFLYYNTCPDAAENERVLW